MLLTEYSVDDVTRGTIPTMHDYLASGSMYSQIHLSNEEMGQEMMLESSGI